MKNITRIVLAVIAIIAIASIAYFIARSKNSGIYDCFFAYCPTNVPSGEEPEFLRLKQFCSSWMSLNDGKISINEPSEQRKKEIINDFRRMGWLSADKNPKTGEYVEKGPVSGCDCIVFLIHYSYSGKDYSALVDLVKSGSSSNSTYSRESCHRHPACVAEITIPELNETFKDAPCR